MFFRGACIRTRTVGHAAARTSFSQERLMPTTNRRDFLKSAAAVSAAYAASSTLLAQDAPPPPANGERITVAVIGTSGRGTQIATTLATLPNVFVKTVCDVDDAHAAS